MHASQVSSAVARAHPPVYGERRTRGADEARSTESVGRRSENHRHHRSENVDGSERSDNSRPARNPLVNAMMQALEGLTQGAGKTTSTAAAQSGDAPKSVKEAALNFANELYGALRAAGESADAAAPKKTGYGDGSSGYRDLAQGLKRLAQGLTAPAKANGVAVAAPAAAAAPVSSPVSVAAPKPVSVPVSAPAPVATAAPTAPIVAPALAAPAPKPVAANPETPKPSAPAPAAGPAPAVSASRSPITINITFNFVNSTAIGAPKASSASTTTDRSADAQADSPLLKAFKDLMAALNGESAEGGAALDNDEAIQMLRGFLQKIAESLGGDAAAQAPLTSLPAKGSLISVTA